MERIKLTKREKVIIGVSLVVVAAVGIQLFRTNKEYVNLAGKICSGGAWKPEFVNGGKEFKLVQVAACCGKGNCHT